MLAEILAIINQPFAVLPALHSVLFYFTRAKKRPYLNVIGHVLTVDFSGLVRKLMGGI